MEIAFSDKAGADLQFWKEAGNVSILKRIKRLFESIQQTPFEGIGKLEQLKHDLSGKWSRRIAREHHLVYSIDDNMITV
ncbi:MAG: Txe/YoeB family addiction module toxin [Sphingobacteriaceae bacterium]|nr:MAG: Txe/YoeB family addiction module toxin [Sphingobacteriaceae bacterium]